MTTHKPKPNPAKYREMSVPFESSDKANEAISAFYEELGALREKHRLANVYVIISATALGEDDEEQGYLSSMHFGHSLEAEGLTAWAYGREQHRREEAIASALKQSRRK